MTARVRCIVKAANEPDAMGRVLTRRSFGSIVALTLILVVGCGDDNEDLPAASATASVGVPAAASLTTEPGYVTSPVPPPGRLAPDVATESLSFTSIRVFADPSSGVFVVHANLTNTGAAFLNDAELQWQILDAIGQVLDQGDVTVATLAPGETTSLVLVGRAAHDDGWASVDFELVGRR